MDRKVKVLLYGKFCGILSQDDRGFTFEYDQSYKGRSLSLSMPITVGTFTSSELHPFFQSLAPEGWLKKRYSELQKIDENDPLGMLLSNGQNLLGAVQLLRLDDDGSEQ
ncbi:type II toxin-antitoxin system HipA family toxin [Vibrio cholerae]|uniref:Type II toxin-antitoxin system HipA family toxin n=1 Tax=Vibrio cholerae TaxID=666 RepID=A0ABD7STI6_VIBCL|nr:HipA N-terminal domain-containing protein [Vibrio cholerae]EGQ8013285.1 type II toxin-antitoxin system HipA family toxin [Vibrio cholerae]EGR4074378.1 type II toxin-antitoxin system HipA family toxin [Vibrio cholerae]EJL6679682.1 HipA N-terminal domain-containing protein [Vibrio cholerae]EJL6709978.1 HipA N-terminal domain-containing protein [Vibrio cholerae]ELO1828310.1 HipA N-terminal domain-containing protein [Vibrio cholerae]